MIKEYTSSDTIRRGFEFEDLCADILIANGAEITKNQIIINEQTKAEVDMIIHYSNNQEAIVEIKAYRTRVPSWSMIEQVVTRMSKVLQIRSFNEKLLIIGLPISKEYKVRAKKEYNVTIIDSNNLYYLIGEDEYLLKRFNDFISDIPESINRDMISEEVDLSYLFKNKKKIHINREIDYIRIAQSLIVRLEEISPGKNEFSEYEDISVEILKFLFSENLFGWHKQLKSKDDLYRYDLVCRIKTGNEFWELLINEFNSRYIVFEFKNYSNKVKQTQVYTTEKYLFQKALRNVCFIVSRFGLDSNAIVATEGILREDGKLIININDDDLVKMINMKSVGDEPSDYLFDLLDQTLLKLSK